MVVQTELDKRCVVWRYSATVDSRWPRPSRRTAELMRDIAEAV
ncbi:MULTISPECIES: hypothetical protein [Nocardia]|nr:hypothetical protein [Nocardia abscessus]